MPRYFCSLPNVKSAGRIPELISDDPVAIAAFVKKWDIPGRGVYECVSILKPGATRRSLETVDELSQIHNDIDLRSLATPGEEVLNKLQNLPLPLELRDSGGGYHVIARLKEPVHAGTPEFDQVNKLRKELTRLFCGDPMPDHAAALLRVVGSHNSKYGEPRLCQVIRPGEPIDVTEIEELVDLLAGHPLFESLPKTNGHGHDESNPQFVSDSGPIDVNERLAAMRLKGPGNSAVHITQLQCSAAMLRTGVALEEMARTVLEATRTAVGDDAEWNWRKEELKILRLGADFIRKNPELTNLLPDEWRQPFEAALAQGRRPDIGLNPRGFYVRAWKTKAAESGNDDNCDNSKAEPAKSASSKSRKSYLPPKLGDVTLEWWTPLDETQLPPREWIYGKHYQRGVISGTIAPGGSGKTSLCMVEAIAMATCRNLLGEQPVERVRVWYHNAEDTQDEVNRRVVAICKHFKIPQEELAGWFIATSCEKFDLRVAKGINDLKVEEPTVEAIADKIHTLGIDVAVIDPLVNVHEVTEDHNTKMAAVAGLFRSIAQGENCGIEFTQHTRKMPAGVNGDYVGADARGASAWRDALRSQRVINIMAKDEAEKNVIPEHERSLYFHVDLGKANNARPREPAWRRIVSVELANGDDVGVVEPWNAPSQDSEDKVRADRIAEELYLNLLGRLTLSGMRVTLGPTSNGAPTVFARQPEAKTAKVGKRAFEAAQDRLLAIGRICAETDPATYGRTKYVRATNKG
jgi:hypothetical protein